MSAPVSMPDESTLRDFLLGNLAPERAEQVEAWLSSDPSAAEVLRRIAADDSLTQALAEPPLPTKLGDYRVVCKIGRGGMGVVLEADDEKLQRPVAVKVLAPERAQDPAAKARFLREARAAAAINHENVVPIHHVGEDGGVPFIVMPLLCGESLDSRLKRDGLLSPAEVSRLGREVAAGLAAAHVRDLVHRDIKPANIWLAAETGKAILLDFGLACAADGTDGLTAPGTIPG